MVFGDLETEVTKSICGILATMASASSLLEHLNGLPSTLLLPSDLDYYLDGPVFLGNEGVDLVLPIDYHAQRSALDAAGRFDADIALQEGGDLKSDDPVLQAPCLLSLYQVHIYMARVLHGLGDGRLGYLVETKAAGGIDRQLQHLGQMPGDRLSLPIRVGRQEHLLRLLGGFG